MAKQDGSKFRGVIDDLFYYKMNGKYFVKRKPDFNKHKFKTHPSFERVRENNLVFGNAAKIASALYRHVPKNERKYGTMNKLHAWTYHRLLEGLNEETIFQYIIDHYANDETAVTNETLKANVTHGHDSDGG